MKTTLYFKGKRRDLSVREVCEEHNKLWKYIINARKSGDERDVDDIKQEYFSKNDIKREHRGDVQFHCFLCEYTSKYDYYHIYTCSLCPKTWTKDIERDHFNAMCCLETKTIDGNIYLLDDICLPENERIHFSIPPINYGKSDPSLVLITEEEILEAIKREKEYEEKYCK